jgi:hypothetical protein
VFADGALAARDEHHTTRQPPSGCRDAGRIMDAMTDFLTGYVVAASASLVSDPGLKASRDGALSVRCGIEDYSAEINAASGDDERTRTDQWLTPWHRRAKAITNCVANRWGDGHPLPGSAAGPPGRTTRHCKTCWPGSMTRRSPWPSRASGT